MKDKLKKKWDQHRAVVYMVLGVVGGLAVASVGYKAGVKTIDVRHAVKIDLLEKDVEKLSKAHTEAIWEAMDNMEGLAAALEYFKATDNDIQALREITGHLVVPDP